MSIFCGGLKEEIERLEVKLERSEVANKLLSKRISAITDRSPLLYTIYFKKSDPIEIIADNYRISGSGFGWEVPNEFFLKNRTVAVFEKIKGFTTKEIDEDLRSNQ